MIPMLTQWENIFESKIDHDHSGTKSFYNQSRWNKVRNAMHNVQCKTLEDLDNHCLKSNFGPSMHGAELIGPVQKLKKSELGPGHET